MSIYSGFPTRKDEQKYNSLLSKLILTLQSHLLQLIPQSFSSSKAKIYSRLIAKMRDFQQHKYLPPKFSQLLDPLAKKLTLHLGVEQRLDTSEEDLRLLLKEDGREKLSAPSLFGLRNKAQTVISVQGSQEIKSLKTQNNQDKRMQTQAKLPKRLMFDESSQVIRAKINKGIIIHNNFSRKSQGSQVQSQTTEAIQNWMTFNKQRGMNSKNGPKFRYKAYNALQQAQNNISKRFIPLREQMRKKLKTQSGNSEL